MQTIYPHLLATHSVLRWLALVAALLATLVAFASWSGPQPGDRKLGRFSVLYVATMDLQFLLGLILYLGVSPVVQQAFQNMSAAMKVHELRFFAVEHSLLMLIAVALAHVGGVLARKSKVVPTKVKGAAICFLLSLIVMLLGIPWFRPLLRLGS